MKQSMQVLTSQKTVEWYTPPWFIHLVCTFFDSPITTDPASSDFAQQWICAETYYTIDNSGLDKDWNGKVFLNPPFDKTQKWVKKLYKELKKKHATEAILLTNSAPGYKWWEELVETADVVVLARERMRFANSEGVIGNQAKKGQTISYFGPNGKAFVTVFNQLGRVLTMKEKVV